MGSSGVAPSAPWHDIQADSEQRQPVYLGAGAREMALGLSSPGAGKAHLPDSLREMAERKLHTLARKLGSSHFDIELWPTQNDQGQRTWAFARWRSGEEESWKWLEPKDDREAFFPTNYRSWIAKERAQIFNDFLALDDLYAKPVFGDCIWSSERGMEVYGAWLPLDSVARTEPLAQSARAVCRVLPQPARLDGQPFELVVRYDSDVLTWPAQIVWDSASALPATADKPAHPITAWPEDFERSYREDVLSLAGEREAVSPRDGRTLRFERKNSADPTNQLLELVTYLEERYAALGIKTRRQSFVWRGIPQANLIAVLPGTARDHALKPVLMADHIDTAFCEDTFAKTRQRVSAPGADDNDSATAALLRAAEILRAQPHERDIWLVHLTGEEFPGDDLGARHLVSELLNQGQDISGLVLMDMIGWHKSGDGVFQISAGESGASEKLAGLALGAALSLAPSSMIPVVRSRFDDHGYLYNTDGLIFSDVGYPVILFNEHLNYLENLNRAGYHQSTDTSAKMDFGFASTIARAAIQTALSLANER